MQFSTTLKSDESTKNKALSSKKVIFLVFIITERFANDIRPVNSLSCFCFFERIQEKVISPSAKKCIPKVSLF